MTVPEAQRPECRLTDLPQGSNFFRVMNHVWRCLCDAKLADQAMEFAQRAEELDVNDDDTTDLLALVVQYVEIV